MFNITADLNPNYGGTLINQKYSPLQNITVDPNEVDDLFFLRKDFLLKGKSTHTLLLAHNINIEQLNLEDELPPPIVVVSSNRAKWIAEMFTHVSQQNIGYNNLNSFENGISLWYDPKRSMRRVYIVVNTREFVYYLDRLKGFDNVYIVAWEFDKDNNIVGFGASRFAAIAMVKELGYEKAWLVDDNVVNINGFPGQLNDIEQLMGNNIWAIGFNASTKNSTGEDIYGINQQKKFTRRRFNFDKAEPGLLQQVVLYNLKLLREKKINISPCFVASNEDVSFSNYLKQKKYIQKIITELPILKMQPEIDGSENAHFVTNARDKLLGDLNGYEKDLFKLKEKLESDGDLEHLKHCHAVEQILAKATTYPSIINIFEDTIKPKLIRVNAR